MKQSDIITIVIIAAIGTLGAFFTVNALMGDPKDASVTYKYIEPVDAALAEPDPEVFNSDAINPTVEVYVGNCLDADQNGVLDRAELVACGRIDDNEEEVNTDGDKENTDPEEEPSDIVEENGREE